MSKAHSIFVLTSLLLALAASAGFSAPASAQSFLDKLKHATQQIQQTTQAIKRSEPQGTTNSHGKNCGSLGAGCLDYMDTVTDCLAPLNGYHAKMWADVIDERLASGAGVSAAQRGKLEEDRAAYRAAEASKIDTVDTRISGRMFEDLARTDQVEANRRYGVFYNQTMSKCNGADHMGVGHTTKLDYIKQQ